MMRFALPVLALFSLFFVPAPLSTVLIAASAFVLPFSALALGVFADVLYFSPYPGALPLWSIGGFVAMLLALLVHRFVKTRIMEA
jgi:hypothetical protein